MILLTSWDVLPERGNKRHCGYLKQNYCVFDPRKQFWNTEKYLSFNEYTISNSWAAVINLSQIVKEMNVTLCKTFEEFANALYQSFHFKDDEGIDLIDDRYFKDSIKVKLRD